MDKLQVISPYHIVLVISACLTLTSAIGDISYMQPVGAGGGMLVHDVSYDTPDHAYIASPFASGLAASPFGGSLVHQVDLGDTYYMPGMPAAPMAQAPMTAMAPMAAIAPSRSVYQSFPSSRQSYSRGITSRRYGGRRMRLYVV